MPVRLVPKKSVNEQVKPVTRGRVVMVRKKEQAVSRSETKIPESDKKVSMLKL
jgi:hypothetical protein